MVTEGQWRTAIHEAAHAVVASRLGLKIVSVQLFSEHHGNCIHEGPYDPLTFAAVALAGPLGEAKHRGVEPDQLASFKPDALIAKQHAPKGEEESLEFFTEAILLADGLIRNKEGWRAVERTARQLVADGTLTHKFFEHG